MYQDLGAIVDRAGKATRAAYDDYRALYLAVESGSHPPSLMMVGADLDRLSITLDLLSRSAKGLANGLARDLMAARVSADVKLSHAIVHDMNAIAGRLRSMIPSQLSEPEVILDEHECRDMSEMVKSYHRAVSSILSHHQISSVDSILSRTDEMMDGVDEIRERLKKKQESADANLRSEAHRLLLPLTSANYNSKDARPGCLENTRVDLQQQLSNWANDGAPELTTLWLSGMAGTGKSAISTTFALNMEDEGILGATFFVDRQIAERRDPHRIIQSIAYDLAERDHNRLHALWSALRAKPTIMDMPLRDQVLALIKEPLEVTDSQTLVIVIDGLDECTPEDGDRLLCTLVASLSSFPIKLLVSSRSDPAIIGSFESIPHTPLRLHERPVDEVAKDIRLYWEDSLDKLCRLRHIPDWRPSVSLAPLVHLTGQLFIYATTILKIVQNTKHKPFEKLKELLGTSDPGTSFTEAHVLSPLDGLYFHILAEAVKDHDGRINFKYALRLRAILEVVIFAQHPLTPRAISQLLDIDAHELDGYLATLVSVLVVPDTANTDGVVRPLHQSFPDFVRQRGGDVHSELAIDAVIANANLTEHCLSLLSKYLRVDICNIRDPSLRNDEVQGLEAQLKIYAPLALQYSCRFWVVHCLDYMRTSGPQCQVPAGLLAFGHTHLLHWIELLSLIHALNDILRALPGLLAVVESHDNLKSHIIASLLADTRYLIATYLAPLTLSALHVYHSGIVSMPQSALRAQVSHHGVGKLVSQRYHEWNTEILLLEGHTGPVNTVAYAPNSAYIVSGSDDHTIGVWDAASGVHKQTLSGHTAPVRSVAYSPDSSMILSSSDDETVKVWNAVSGEHQRTLIGHAAPIRALAFSPDGSDFISGSDDHTVRLWNVITGTHKDTMLGHTGDVNSVAFSPDGSQFISGSRDCTVRVWDSRSGAHRRTLSGHTDAINSVIFSPNGFQIISGSDDCTVRVCDAISGALKHVFKGQTKVMKSVASSSDSAWTMSDTFDLSGGYTDCISSVAFSPDSSMIISGSLDNTVRVWDAASGAHKQTLRGHTDRVNSVAFSPEGLHIISGSDDGTLRVYVSVLPGVALDTSKGRGDWKKARKFFFGDSQAALGPHSRSMRLSPGPQSFRQGLKRLILLPKSWVQLGKAIISHPRRDFAGSSGAAMNVPSHDHAGPVTCVNISSDGLHVITASGDCTVRVWDAVSGEHKHTLVGHTGSVGSVAFSPNGSQIISGSDDQTLRVWDTLSGTLKQTLRGHKGWIRSVAFSPNGSQFASGSDDFTVRLWGAVSGIQMHALTGHTHWVSFVVFSPDGSQIVSASSDCTVRVWDTVSGAQKQTLSEHTDPVTFVAFSSNGSQIISGSDDCTVRVWDAGTGIVQHVLDGFNAFNNTVQSILGGSPLTKHIFVGCPEQSNGFTLVPNDGWILRRGADGIWRRVCWLPHNRRYRGVLGCSGERVCVGTGSGVVTILDFIDVVPV